MFGRQKNEQTTARSGSTAVTTAPEVPARPGAKNRPTPSRKEAEAARRHPIVPADRAAAKRESKAAERASRAKHREAMLRGEDWALGPRDRGRQRAFVRDMVDSRWNLGEFLLPVMIIALPISLVQQRWAAVVAYIVLYGMLIGTALDAFLLARRVAKRVRTELHEEPMRGNGWYVFSRSVQFRSGRMPRPRVARGGAPLA